MLRDKKTVHLLIEQEGEYLGRMIGNENDGFHFVLPSVNLILGHLDYLNILYDYVSKNLGIEPKDVMQYKIYPYKTDIGVEHTILHVTKFVKLENFDSLHGGVNGVVCDVYDKHNYITMSENSQMNAEIFEIVESTK